MLRMGKRVTGCWNEFLQLAALSPTDAVDDAARDLAAAQPREIEQTRRPTPCGINLTDRSEEEQLWVKEEEEAREDALKRAGLWRAMPEGSGGDSEAFDRY
eukprot:12090343-Alexandrium_andersonii.AAC.1